MSDFIEFATVLSAALNDFLQKVGVEAEHGRLLQRPVPVAAPEQSALAAAPSVQPAPVVAPSVPQQMVFPTPVPQPVPAPVAPQPVVGGAKEFPDVISAGDIHTMRRTQLDRLINEKGWPVAHPQEVMLKDLKATIVAFLSTQNAPAAVAQVLASPAPFPAAALPASMPVSVVQAPAPSPAPAAFVPPMSAAPAVTVPPPAAPSPIVDQRPGKIEAFRAGVAQMLAEQNGIAYGYWTQKQYQLATELETLFHHPTNGLLSGAQTKPEQKAAAEIFVQQMGCTGKCSQCPVSPGQVPYCYGIFETTLPFTYVEAGTRGHFFRVNPSPNPSDAASGEAQLVHTPMNGQPG